MVNNNKKLLLKISTNQWFQFFRIKQFKFSYKEIKMLVTSVNVSLLNNNKNYIQSMIYQWRIRLTD